MVLFGKGDCIWAKVVVFGQKWLSSSKSGCIRANGLYSVRNCCILAKAVVFGQGGCLRAKLLY